MNKNNKIAKRVQFERVSSSFEADKSVQEESEDKLIAEKNLELRSES